MTRERPTAVLVMAILNMVFGGLGVVCGVCGVAGLMFLLSLPTSSLMANVPPQDRAAMASAFAPLEQFKTFMIGNMVLSIIMAVVLVVAGIGLLKMQPWARWASIFYAVVTIISALAGVYINSAYINPAMEKWQRDMVQKQGQAGAPAPNQQMSNMASSIGGAVVSMAYSIALLVVMFLPSVTAAFAGRRPSDGMAPDPGADYDRRY